MRASMKLIKLHLRKYIIRRKWRAVIRGFVKRMRGSLSRIQKMCRWRARQRRVLAEVNKRIQIKRKEAEERKWKEEAERVKREQDEYIRQE